MPKQMSFDILASYGVVVPEPLRPVQNKNVVTRTIAPREKPPVDQEPIAKTHRNTINFLHMTSNQLASLSLEEKEVLVQQLRNKKNKMETQAELLPQQVLDHVHNAWCPCCVNEYLSEKEKALRKHQKDMDGLLARQAAEDANAAKDAEKEKERLQKAKNGEELKRFLEAEDALKKEKKAQQKAEQEAFKAAHAEQMKKFEEAFAARQADKHKEGALREAELAENARLKAEAKARELEEDKKRNPNMPTGMIISPEEKQRRLEEMLKAFDADQAAKQGQKAAEKAQQQRMRDEALKSLEDARAEADRRRAQKAEEQRQAGDQYKTDQQLKAEEKARQKAEDIDRGRQQRNKVAAEEAAEKAARQAVADKQRADLGQALSDGKRQDDLNKELEKLLSKVNQIQSMNKTPAHQTECDRCEDPNDPAMMTVMSAEELADAAKYVDLKKKH